MKNWIYVLGTILTISGCAKLQPNAENQTITSNQAGGGTTTQGTATSPSFSPTSGAYAVTQNVAISSTTAGATICYAVNPTQPACNAAKTSCATGTLYSTAVAVSTTQTLNARACKTNYNDSAVASAAYTIDTTAPSVPTGFGGTPISTSQIDLNWTASTDAVTSQANLIYEICQSGVSGGCSTFSPAYTTGAGSTSYSVTGLSANTTYYFVIRAKDGVGNASASTSQISLTTAAAGSVNTPTLSPTAGTYGATQNVAISSTTGSATICYTTSGATPACDAPKTGCATGTLYAGTIAVSSSQTLKAIGCKPGFTDSAVNSGAYVIDTTPPGNVTGFTATAGNGQIPLSWTNPGDADFSGVKILRKTGSYPANSTDGTTVYNNTGTSYTDTGLTNGTQYYYKAFAYDTVGNYASGAQASQTPTVPDTAIWARSTSAGVDNSSFNSIAIDSVGNIYAAGNQWRSGNYTYGSGITINGTNSNGPNALLVSYASDGTPQWAKTVTAGTSHSDFNALIIDSSNNIYTAGYQNTNGSYTYAAGVTLAGVATTGNASLIKYNTSGVAQWARTLTSIIGSGSDARFNSVTVDTSGLIYACGYQFNSATYNYNGISVAGAASTYNATFVKFNTGGGGNRASSTQVAPDESQLFGIVADAAGNLYAIGRQVGPNSYTYYNGVSVTGPEPGTFDYNPILIKYTNTGAAVWAKPLTSTPGNSLNAHFNGMALDAAGNIYVVGYQLGTGTYCYATGVCTTSTGSNGGPILIKYNSSGIAQWARTFLSGSGGGSYQSLAISSSGIIYAVGYQGNGAHCYDSGVCATGTVTGNNAVIVKYNNSGTAQWVQTVTSGTNESQFNGVVIDSSTGNLYAAGFQKGSGTNGYGSSVSVAGSATGTYKNAFLVKYGP